MALVLPLREGRERETSLVHWGQECAVPCDRDERIIIRYDELVVRGEGNGLAIAEEAITNVSGTRLWPKCQAQHQLISNGHVAGEHFKDLDMDVQAAPVGRHIIEGNLRVGTISVHTAIESSPRSHVHHRGTKNIIGYGNSTASWKQPTEHSPRFGMAALNVLPAASRCLRSYGLSDTKLLFRSGRK